MEKTNRETSSGAVPSAYISAAGLRVSVVAEIEEIESLREEWNRLLAESASDSIFLSPEWTLSWWEAYGGGRKLNSILFYRNDRLVGIAPLYRATSRWLGLFPLHRIQIIGDGSGDSDYLDIIAQRGEEGAVASSLLDFLEDTGRAWHVLALHEVPSTSPMLQRIREEAAGRGLLLIEKQIPSTRADLPAAWDAYIASLKPRMRTKVRSLLKKITTDSRLSFRVLDDPALLNVWLESLYRLHEARWHLKKKSGVFVHQDRRNFYQRLSPQLLKSGLLRLYGLFLDEQPIALEYCFAWRDRVLLLDEGFDPAYAEEGAGNMLRARVFQDCMEKGVAAYDFLGGVTQHKISWGGSVHSMTRLLIGKRRLRTAIHIYRPLAKERLKGWLKRILPRKLIEKLQRDGVQ